MDNLVRSGDSASVDSRATGGLQDETLVERKYSRTTTEETKTSTGG
jgi:hypothetical protein